MEKDLREAADRLFEEALDRSGARDPRGFYRQALRELRTANPQAYREAVDHFQEILVPEIASGKTDPLLAWREYGRRIAEATAAGRTLAIDESGRGEPYSPGVPLDRLVLHLPEEKKLRAILVSLPSELSPAQRATYDLLVRGKQTLPGGS